MNSMNFTAADATAMNQAQLDQEVAFAMARKNLDAQKQQGAAAMQLLEGAANLAKQGPITPGKGLSLNVRG
ncbi:MAG: YjfB family protein [Algisphaera sp.]